MNIFEVIGALLALLVSIILGRILFGFIGWWSIIPGILCGVGSVLGSGFILDKLFTMLRRQKN